VRWYKRYRLKRSSIVPAVLAIQILVLSACPGLLVSPFDSQGLTAEAHAATSKPACPARDFHSFVEAFAESAAVQRQYTRLPFVYGHLDVDLIGTDDDKAFSRKLIRSFDAIQYRDPEDDNRIFPSNTKRKKKGFRIQIGRLAEYPGNKTIVLLFLPDTGFGLYFRFVRAEGCWSLIGIDDRST